LLHFQTITVYNELKLKYFWPRMMKDIDFWVKSCLTCQRNQKFHPIEHPARALPITGLFDRICVDLQFGLAESLDGFTGLCVIVEYLSKNISIFPIKSKQAVEIASCLWRYISKYGPPKSILHDQGKEFMNDVVTKMLERTGIERRTTQAYNPRTDGLCERANQTVAEILRKCVEANPRYWPEWIPFVELAYNTRLNSTTVRLKCCTE
jgi:transposase InsO family protein